MDTNYPKVLPKEEVENTFEADNAVYIKLEQVDPFCCVNFNQKDEINTDKHNLIADIEGKVKMEEQAADGLEVKFETLQSSTKTEDMDATELTEELNFKPDVTSDVKGAREKRVQRRTHILVGSNTNEDSSSCDKCRKTSRNNNVSNNLSNVHCSHSKTCADKQSVGARSRYLNEYVCTQCKMMYKRKVSLDHHMLKIHTDHVASVSSKTWKCPKCTYVTTRKSDFDKHVLIHDRPDRPNRHTTAFADRNETSKSKLALNDEDIEDCIDSTDIQSFLDTHIPEQLKSGSDYKLRPCNLCSAIFKRQRTLDDHIIKKHPHVTELVTSKVHECSDCPYKTTIKVNLDRHIISIHRPSAAVVFNTCTYCDKALKSKRGLDDHILRKHPNFVTSFSRKIHECTHCSFRTIIKSDFDKHIQIH
ncbi:unnamed protein product [Callosobruchus maculatus]|uniref:C2H2-type domain-containing protein n=1 Tax=Callosobruchus maculatus TaxID=64391 RepID=A0A653BT24_CALMS|nr:unnamed protein product [Callosobruchus maculatus]